MALSFDNKTTDWKIQGIADLDVGAEFLAAGGFGFNFANISSQCIHTFLFVGLGLGVGSKEKIKSGPAKLISGNLLDGNWEELDVLNAFSGDDLDMSVGQIISGGASFVIGAHLALLSGGISLFHAPFFRLAPCAGFALGLGAGASILSGLWIKTNTVFASNSKSDG